MPFFPFGVGSYLTHVPTLPFAPLMPFRPATDLTRRPGWRNGMNTATEERLQRMWYRGQASGRISVFAADEICVGMLGLHPSLVFGEMWWA